MKSQTIRRTTVSAVMLALSTVLALVCALIPFLNLPFGGCVTIASALPIVIISYMYGIRHGLFTSFAYALIQIVADLMLGHSSVILALFSIVSFWAFDLLHRKVFRNEVFCSAVIFAGSAVCAGALYVANLTSASVAISMILMALIVACMHGINVMLLSVVPKRFLRSGKVSTFSGLLNAFTYVGASLSTYGIAVLSDLYGWNVTILLWLAVTVIGIAVCLAATPLWKKFRSEYADL